ncbi:Zinc-finger homeodomain protein [Quillaja saponaria]|uniref:Zinc-finger homeodomain protein n=1 Tax=Quillaja saponaria TaxID=32244 RepID=A0AAD7PTU1_QUISA|nr:Zinc-finger homeodomain protein [Quillaja saponaria]
MASSLPNHLNGMNVAPTPTFQQAIIYRECNRNHAALLGHVAFDGCREFLQAGGNGTKEAFKCIACGCHRNFHRRDVIFKPILPINSFVANSVAPAKADPPLPQPAEEDTEERGRKRRKRASYTEDQRDELKAFADKLGWKPQSHDKEQVEKFCLEMGISRRVFMLWLYNNKNLANQKTETSRALVTKP